MVLLCKIDFTFSYSVLHVLTFDSFCSFLLMLVYIYHIFHFFCRVYTHTYVLDHSLLHFL